MRLTLLAFMLLAPSPVHVGWSELTPLPSAVTGSAVASIVHKDRALIFSFMGMGKEKTNEAVTQAAMVLDSRRDQWLLLPPVPGKQGRLGATAVSIDGQIYLLGGYTLDENGKKVSVSDLDIYTPGPDEPALGYWAKGLPLPIPVDDFVAGVFENRYIFVVSGWSQDLPIANVQIYDTLHDHWRPGNVIQGVPVFGHGGAIAGRYIVYCGGMRANPEWKAGKTPAAQRFVRSDECWQGKITADNQFKIQWLELPAHPGKANFHLAAGAWNKQVVFTGGTEASYDYAEAPAFASAVTFSWDPDRHAWETLPDVPESAVDQRGLAADQTGLVSVGGMQNQKVVKRVVHLRLK